MNQVWIIEDDAMYAQMLKRQIEKSGEFEAVVFNKAEQVLNGKSVLPKAIFLDYQLPGDNGVKVLEYVQGIDKELPVIVVSGQEDPTIAVTLIKKGAYQYLTKTPHTPRQLAAILAKLGRQIRMKTELEALRNELSKKNDFKLVMGSSAAITKLEPLFEKASRTAIVVSLHGETGVGKETLAKTIHFNSSRATGSFLSLQLKSIPASDFDRTLNGAIENGELMPGAFANTENGTLLLEEIADLDLYNQAKLIKILQHGAYMPVNGVEEKKMTSRIIVSTNRDLKELVRTGAFREDLYYKILGLPIQVPALKDRRADVLVLARKFTNSFCRANEMNILRFDAATDEKLLNYNWPGNIRELKAVVELACVMSNGDTIMSGDIRYEDTSPSEDLLSKERPLRDYTAHIIEYFLGKYEGDIPRVASVLDIGKSSIYRMIKNGEIKNINK